jgi:hypothetical protein
MVRLKEGGSVTAKIIDLGLAKTLDESATEAGISSSGAFAGTPEFASPEQFAGVGADIRSDLYSLGVVLWEMVTGHAVFRGSLAEVMYQHQHAPLPLDLLGAVAQPVVALLEVLLEKDPAQRFQTPNELLKGIPAITDAIDARHRITRQSLQRTPSAASASSTRRLPGTRRGPKKVSIARLPVTSKEVFGREENLAFLEAAWADAQVNVVTVVAWAGVGKSTLINHWLRRMAAEHYRSAQLVFGWSFYRQGTRGEASSADEFLDAALSWFGDADPRQGSAWEKGERLARLITRHRTLLVLDGLSRSKTRPVRRKAGCVILPSKRFCASWPPSTKACALSPRGCRWRIWPSTRVARSCAVTWNTFPVRLERNCYEHRELRDPKPSCGRRVRSLEAIAWRSRC